MTPPLVLSLDDPATTDLDAVGGKGASLARLVEAGFPVPRGFCVTTAAYQLLTDDEAVHDAVAALSGLDPDDTAGIAERSEAVRETIRARPIPEAVSEAVETALADLGGDAYAVRSSATAEDLPTASFAGQHETFLGVGPDEVTERVRDCMASLFTERAVAYRLRNGVPQEGVALAVVVQEIVEAAVAGVLFTADPLTGNRTVATVDASFGLGESVVSGTVTSDTARIDRQTGEVLEYTVGEKAVAVRSRANRGTGTETVELPAETRTTRALSDDQLRDLVALGGRAEALLGVPQDIEWAFVESEASDAGSDTAELVLLQSRPITSLFPLPTPAPADDGLHVYFSFSHAQAMPEAMPPLVVDFWTGFLNAGFSGVSDAAREGRLAVSAGGRIYADITAPVRVDPLRQRLPERMDIVNEPAADGLGVFFDQRGDSLPPYDGVEAARWVGRLLYRGRAGIAARLPQALGRFGRAFLVGPPAPQVEREWVETWGRGLAAEVRAPDDLSARVRTVFDGRDFSTVLGEVFPRIGPLLVSGVTAGAVLNRQVPDAEADVDAVGKGFDEEIVTRINQRLGDLADLARETPAVADALRAGATPTDLEAVPGSEAFLTELDDFLDEFGHRATGEIDISRPRWRDAPAGLLQSVRGSLQQGTPGEHRAHLRRLERDATAAAARLERRADHGPLGPVRRRVVRRLVRTYRGGIQLREYPKQGLGHLFTAWHDTLAEAGDALAAEGRLDRADDVWYLHREELLDALEGEGPIPVDIAARRREFERDAAMTAPPLLTSEGEDLTALAVRDVPPGTLVGTPVSAGVVEGPARVVHDPTTTSLEPGEILVAQSSDPGWTPLFLNAAGVVTEVGGRMTHGALVAREYGLPAVVSVRNATHEIRTGQRIRVDGTQGTVELLERS